MGAGPSVDEWTGRDVTVADIERQLARLRIEGGLGEHASDLRTSVMTHVAWVPQDWLAAARETLSGLAERHPSRTILLVPEPDARDDAIHAELSLQCFALGDGRICCEVVELRLCGARVRAPASIVAPLAISGLPAFLRWRGRPAFGAPELDELVDVVDRLVVDSGEWPDVDYAPLLPLFDRVAVSDIAWARTRDWRQALARRWPAVGSVRRLHVAGPGPEAALLAGWLRSRLARAEIELVHDPAENVERVAFDGEECERPRVDNRDASDLLSEELDRFSRDRVYEAAAAAVS